MTSPRRVLLLDAAADRAAIVQRLGWEFPGLCVEDAPDPAAFTRALEAGGFDLVITEAALPWIEGPGVLRAVKARWPECPVIMLAAAVEAETAVAALRGGAADYLPKSPGYLARLGPAVRQAVRAAAGGPPTDGEPAGAEAPPPLHSQAEFLLAEDPSPVLCIRRDGTVAYANPASSWLLTEWGSGPGRPVPALWRTLVTEVLERRTRRVVEAPYGDRVYSFTLVPTAGAGAAVLFAADVTPRKRLEDALQESQRALEAARRAGGAWWEVAEASPAPLALLDPDGRIERANRALAELLGRGADELTGRTASRLLDGLEAPPAESALSRCLETCEAVSEDWTPPGSCRVFLRTYSPLRDAQGALAGVVLTAVDVSEEQRRERRRGHAESTADLQRLISGLAHELNNPLTALLGHAQFLLLAGADEKVGRRAEIIVQEAERMAKIVRNLVAFGRPRRPDRHPLSLREVVEAALAARRTGLEAGGTRVILDLPPDLPAVMGNAEQLQQVFTHLLQNAEEALAARGGKGEVRISGVREAAGSGLRVVVEDDGPGIPEALLGKLFDPFVTTRGAGEGAGLGLALCSAIVKEHDGTMQAENRPEGGARITIRLAAEGPGSRGCGPGCPGGRILVVDDQEAVAQFVAGALALDGHVVDTAAGGRRAAAMLEEREYDLVLMDFNMPDGRGDQLYREVRARRHPGPRMALMTGDTLDQAAAAFLAEARLPLLEKPFTIQAVRDFVRALWSRPQAPEASSPAPASD
ncbi:MAG: response regulator [Candidatus Methylomirabilales bacterium]